MMRREMRALKHEAGAAEREMRALGRARGGSGEGRQEDEDADATVIDPELDELLAGDEVESPAADVDNSAGTRNVPSAQAPGFLLGRIAMHAWRGLAVRWSRA